MLRHTKHTYHACERLVARPVVTPFLKAFVQHFVGDPCAFRAHLVANHFACTSRADRINYISK